MDPLVAAAVLAASLLHAAWHALVKSSGDQVVALAGMNLVSGAVALALIPLTSPLPRVAYAVIAGSVLLHVGYKLALARLYLRADLGQAYPLARGLTPVMAALLAFIALGELSAPLALAGICLVCAGIASLAFERRGITPGVVGAAAAAGVAVAAYSVVDAYGIRLSGDWFSFTVWLVLLDSAAFVSYTLATRGAGATRAWKNGWGRVLVSGCLGVGAFGVFMWALGRAPVGPVTALRETSVLFAAMIGALILRERTTWKRYAAAVAVMVGVGVIALGK
jgi:drug/metabolite transporter (DMT)-like permease